MSVDFPASHSAPAVSAGKPVDVQTLQETFAAALRSFGTEKGTSQTNTLLEVLRPEPASNGAENDRNQQRRDTQQRTDKADFAQIDRKQLDRAEVRNGEMNTDYRNRQDRQETLRNEYQERTERSGHQQPPAPPPMFAAPLDAARPGEPLPNGNPSPPQQHNVSEVASANIPSSPATVAAPNNAVRPAQVNVIMPVSANTPAVMPTPAAPQPVAPQTFTIFTPAGRFGQQQGKPEDDEDEKEEPTEEKLAKKRPFAAFEAIRAETTRPIQRNHSQQSKEPVARPEPRQVAESPRERPRETEQSQTIKTMDELLNTPPQNISGQKKGEPNAPNQTQYLNRIAAACEAAGQFAPIRIKINLDHLGTLTLRFFHKADKLALSFATPSRRTAQFLRDNLDELRTILTKRNVKTMDVEIMWEE